MPTSRLEAFSDGVIAIAITLIALELKIPEGTTLQALRPVVPVFLTFALSFIYLGIYWNNHHHLLGATTRVTGGVLWANLHLLFWLSLFPFATGWMGENEFAEVPTAVYGCVLLAAALAYYILQSVIVRAEGDGSRMHRALRRDIKGKSSPVLYALGIALSLVNHWLGLAVYVGVATMWLIPDRRLEATIAEAEEEAGPGAT